MIFKKIAKIKSGGKNESNMLYDKKVTLNNFLIYESGLFNFILFVSIKLNIQIPLGFYFFIKILSTLDITMKLICRFFFIHKNFRHSKLPI